MAEIIQLKNRSNGEDQHPKTTTDAVSHNNTPLPSVLDAKQAKLVEGDNITLTSKADGTVEISASGGGGSSTPVVDNLNSTSTTSALSANQGKVLNSKFANKQDNLVSGTNIKTINGQSVLGGGNITIEGGGGESVDVVNNLTSDRIDAALAAAQGKVLDTKITQLSSEAVIGVVAQTSGDIELADNTQFTYSTVPSEITISLPSDWTAEGLSVITFTAGGAAPQITFPEGVSVKGIIEANKKVEINIYNNNAIIMNV